MKKIGVKLFLFVTVAFVIYSCQKDEVNGQRNTHNHPNHVNWN